jgi:hypothetical protein
MEDAINAKPPNAIKTSVNAQLVLVAASELNDRASKVNLNIAKIALAIAVGSLLLTLWSQYTSSRYEQRIFARIDSMLDIMGADHLPK